MSRGKTCFATVGSTQFTALVSSVLSPPSLEALAGQGFTRLVVQYGHSALPEPWAQSATVTADGSSGLEIELFKFKDGIEDCVKQADLVVGHAGAGSILTTLRLSKSLIVVVNLALMDNHQSELAETLLEQRYLLVATPGTLAETIETLEDAKTVPFPPPQEGAFRRILDWEMGYTD